MDNSSVKDNISNFRKSLGLSQSEMAERLGMSRNAYRNLEKGMTKLISENVDKIAAVLNKSSEEIVLGYNPSRKDSEQIGEMQAEYRKSKNDMELRHDAEISVLNEQITTLSKLITAQQEIIKTKEEIISMLKKKLAENGMNV